jgi:hypothetical protein
MKRLSNFLHSSRLSVIALTLVGTQSSWAIDLAYKVMLNGSEPLADAYVTLQTPGGKKTVVTKTNQLGKFAISGIDADKVLVTIEKNGSTIYRGINKVEPSEKTIDLKSKSQ